MISSSFRCFTTRLHTLSDPSSTRLPHRSGGARQEDNFIQSRRVENFQKVVTLTCSMASQKENALWGCWRLVPYFKTQKKECPPFCPRMQKFRSMSTKPRLISGLHIPLTLIAFRVDATSASACIVKGDDKAQSFAFISGETVYQSFNRISVISFNVCSTACLCASSTRS